MKIVEIFLGCQGEGMRTGKLSTFIRVAGCNLKCLSCDTRFSYTEKAEDLTIDEIIKQVPNDIKDAVISGGEPILPRREDEMYELLRRLWAIKKWVTVETNSTHYIARLTPYVNLWSLSPKLSCMGKKNKCNINVISEYVNRLDKNTMQLKFVLIPEMKDELLSVLKKIPSIMVDQIPVILQPMSENFSGDSNYVEEIKDCFIQLLDVAKGLKDYNVFVMLQNHKVIWGNKRGV